MRILAFLLILCTAASAQVGPPYFPQTLPSGTVVGRTQAGTGPASAITLKQLAGALPIIPASPVSATNFGWNCDSTDHSTQALAALNSLAQSGGGTLFFPPCPTSYFTASASGTTLTVSAVSQGALSVGQFIYGNSVPVGLQIVGLGTGSGGAGTYTLSASFSTSSAQFVAQSTYRADSQLLIPNDAASPQPHQANIRLTGAGGGQNWYSEANNGPGPSGPGTTAAVISPMASTLDLRYHGSGSTGGKIESLGLGALTIDNLQIQDGSTAQGTPFIHTTNTVLTAKNNSFLGSGDKSATVTIDIASPAVIHWTGHPMVYGSTVEFTTTGSLPTGITANTPYYVISAGLTANAFEISNRVGGAAINTSVSQSGTQTAHFDGQDAIVLGGPTTNIDGTTTAAFQGYGTSITNNNFSNLNRMVFGQTFANSSVVGNNTWIWPSGSRAIEFASITNNGSDNINGLYVYGNTIEMQSGITPLGPVYGIVLQGVRGSTFSGNSCADASTPALSCYYLSTGSSGVGSITNVFIAALKASFTPPWPFVTITSDDPTQCSYNTFLDPYGNTSYPTAVDCTGNGAMTNTIGGGLVVSQAYASANTYSGGLTVRHHTLPGINVSLGVDGSNAYIDPNNGGSNPLPLVIQPRHYPTLIKGLTAFTPAAVTLANGLNSNINFYNGSGFGGNIVGSYMRVSGPTGAFSLGGFFSQVTGTSSYGGELLVVYNSTSQAMTIVNEDASSTATNRIKTTTGANVVLPAGVSTAYFVYDDTDTRWYLLATEPTPTSLALTTPTLTNPIQAGVAFASLPGSPTAGQVGYVTDGKASNCGDSACSAFGTTVTGGTGALKLLVWYNGTNWTLIGK